MCQKATSVSANCVLHTVCDFPQRAARHQQALPCFAGRSPTSLTPRASSRTRPAQRAPARPHGARSLRPGRRWPAASLQGRSAQPAASWRCRQVCFIFVHTTAPRIDKHLTHVAGDELLHVCCTVAISAALLGSCTSAVYLKHAASMMSCRLPDDVPLGDAAGHGPLGGRRLSAAVCPRLAGMSVTRERHPKLMQSLSSPAIFVRIHASKISLMLQVQPDYLFVSTWNEHLAQPQVPTVPPYKSMGLETDNSSSYFTFVGESPAPKLKNNNQAKSILRVHGSADRQLQLPLHLHWWARCQS